MSEGAKNARLMNFGRPVLISDQDWKTKEVRERKGTFHVWGYKRVGGKDSPPLMMTVAVVELEDGRVTTKSPDFIRFLDK